MKNDIVTRYRSGGLPDPKIQWPTMHFESGGGASAGDGSGNGGTSGSDTGADGSPGNSDSGPADGGSDTGVSDASAATGIAGIGASDAAAATGASSSVGVGGVGGDVGGLGGVSIGSDGQSSPTGQAAGNGISFGQIASLAAAVISGNPAAVAAAVANMAGQPGVANAIGIASNMANGNIAGAISGIGNMAGGIGSGSSAGVGVGSGGGGEGMGGGGCGGLSNIGSLAGCSAAMSLIAGATGSTGSKSGLSAGASGATSDTSDPFLDAKAEMLLSKVRNTGDTAALKELIQIYSAPGQNQVDPTIPVYASGGTTSCDYAEKTKSLNLVPETPDFLSPLSSGSKTKKQSALSQLKHIQPKISNMGNMDGMAQGGLPKKYQDAAPDGHNTEFVTGLTGFYACGRGTGQSDCIPAMLHDGDYVMDAEAVSALGDGSSKAGKEVLEKFHKQIPHHAASGGKVVPARIADGEYVFPAGFVTALGGGDNKRGSEILDGLREKLRNHKRSAPTSKIPPKAKSPLDYLKMAKG